MSKLVYNEALNRDVNLTWSDMWSHITAVCDNHCPYVTFSVDSKPPFIDDNLLKRMKARDKAFAHARRSHLASDMVLAKYLRQSITRALRKAKREFILEQIEINNGNSKKFWDIINSNFFAEHKPVMTQIVDMSDGRYLKVLWQLNTLTTTSAPSAKN